VAAVVEVAVNDKGELAIPRVDMAVDCGAQIVPERVRAQMEGACVMGVSLATTEEITCKAGRVEQDHYHAYQVARMATAPREIRVHLVPGGLPRAARRRGRTRRAADRACPLQRHLCGDRQAHPAPAGPRSAQGLSARIPPMKEPSRWRRGRAMSSARSEPLTSWRSRHSDPMAIQPRAAETLTELARVG
jgi:hypothetical protein